MEDRNHLLLYCRKGTGPHNELRKKTNNMNLCTLFMDVKAIKALIKYMENTGIFTKDKKPVMLWPKPRPPPEPPPEPPPKGTNPEFNNCIIHDTDRTQEYITFDWDL